MRHVARTEETIKTTKNMAKIDHIMVVKWDTCSFCTVPHSMCYISNITYLVAFITNISLIGVPHYLHTLYKFYAKKLSSYPIHTKWHDFLIFLVISREQCSTYLFKPDITHTLSCTVTNNWVFGVVHLPNLTFTDHLIIRWTHHNIYWLFSFL